MRSSTKPLPRDLAAARRDIDRWRAGNGQRRLIPETTFTIEDGVGDVVGTRIRVLAEGAPGR